MEANRAAFYAEEKITRLTMNGAVFQQKTFKYQAKTLEELRDKYSTVAEVPALAALLDQTGCAPFLKAA
jgi:hypothetical protein